MNTSSIRFFFCSALLLAACDGGSSFTDSGSDAATNDTMASDVSRGDASDIVVAPDADTGASTDSSTTDAGTAVDSGSTTDSGGTTDSGSTTDSGIVDSGTADSGGGVCPPTGTGASCDSATPCIGGFVCDLGRCIPQGRETCGGFAGAPCTDATYSECLYQTGHGDVGTCFSRSERACLCDVSPDQWSCR